MIKDKKQIDANTYEVEFTAEAAVFKANVDKQYRLNKNKYSVPGFRKGKASMKMIEQMYGPVFTQPALEGVYETEIEKVREELGEGLIDVNSAEVVSMEGDVVFKAKAVFKPEVKIEGYKGLTVEKGEATVSDEDVEKELKRVQERNSRLLDVDDRAAQIDDTVKIDYKGFSDGEAFDGGSAEDHTIKLGSGEFIPGFEEQIVGHNIGDEFDVNVTFPEEYFAEDLKGKPVVFKVKLKEIKMTEIPELDDEFAKDVSEFDTLAEYTEDLRKDLLAKAQEKENEDAESALMDKVIDLLDADIPDVMYEQKIDENINNFAYRLSEQGMSVETYMSYLGMDAETLRGQFRPQSISQVKLRLALEKIAELEGISVSDEECEKGFEDLAATYNQSVEEVKKIVPVEGIRKDLEVEKAAELVSDSANYVPKTEKAEEEPEAEGAEE